MFLHLTVINGFRKGKA